MIDLFNCLLKLKYKVYKIFTFNRVSFLEELFSNPDGAVPTLWMLHLTINIVWTQQAYIVVLLLCRVYIIHFISLWLNYGKPELKL